MPAALAAAGSDAEPDEQDDEEEVQAGRGNDAAEDTQGAAPGGADGGKKKKKRPLPPIRINLSNCKYEVLRIVQRKLGWREVGDDEEWDVYWTDTSVTIERIMKLSRTQKINHFHGMLELCRKRSMARNLQKIQKLFPEHYDFFPRTFILPGDMQELSNDVKARGKKQIYILKPDAGCQGKGIRLMQGGKEETLQKTLKEMDTLNVVAQHYLPKPFLIHGYKFDMRIYSLVLSCDPLRIFVYKEGLARICTEKYTKPKASNLGVSYMHLTNYAVNKHNEQFVANQGGAEDAENASKLGLAQLAEYINSQGHDWDSVWASIQQLIVKSVISVQPILKNNYRSALPLDNDGFSCFEVLGFDIMLDEELRPWLIECNHSSSFNIDSPLDLAIKEALITDTFEVVRVDPKIIAATKKMEKKAAAGRLTAAVNMQRGKRAAAEAGPGAAAAAATPGSAEAATPEVLSTAAGPGAPGGGAGGTAAGPGVAATAASGAGGGSGGVGQATPGAKAWGGGPGGAGGGAEAARAKTYEELEAARAEVLRKREKYEERHLGAYTRIYPSEDPELQAMYERLLKGSAEVFASGFASKAKKTLDSLTEERRKREEAESESARAEKARARAHRDRLAQQALERRRQKAAEAEWAAMAGGMGSGAAAAGGLAAPGSGYGYGHGWGGGYGGAAMGQGQSPMGGGGDGWAEWAAAEARAEAEGDGYRLGEEGQGREGCGADTDALDEEEEEEVPGEEEEPSATPATASATGATAVAGAVVASVGGGARQPHLAQAKAVAVATLIGPVAALNLRSNSNSNSNATTNTTNTTTTGASAPAPFLAARPLSPVGPVPDWTAAGVGSQRGCAPGQQQQQQQQPHTPRSSGGATAVSGPSSLHVQLPFAYDPSGTPPQHGRFHSHPNNPAATSTASTAPTSYLVAGGASSGGGGPAAPAAATASARRAQQYGSSGGGSGGAGVPGATAGTGGGALPYPYIGEQPAPSLASPAFRLLLPSQHSRPGTPPSTPPFKPGSAATRGLVLLGSTFTGAGAPSPSRPSQSSGSVTSASTSTPGAQPTVPGTRRRSSSSGGAVGAVGAVGTAVGSLLGRLQPSADEGPAPTAAGAATAPGAGATAATAATAAGGSQAPGHDRSAVGGGSMPSGYATAVAPGSPVPSGPGARAGAGATAAGPGAGAAGAGPRAGAGASAATAPGPAHEGQQRPSPSQTTGAATALMDKLLAAAAASGPAIGLVGQGATPQEGVGHGPAGQGSQGRGVVAEPAIKGPGLAMGSAQHGSSHGVAAAAPAAVSSASTAAAGAGALGAGLGAGLGPAAAAATPAVGSRLTQGTSASQALRPSGSSNRRTSLPLSVQRRALRSAPSSLVSGSRLGSTAAAVPAGDHHATSPSLLLYTSHELLAASAGGEAAVADLSVGPSGRDVRPDGRHHTGHPQGQPPPRGHAATAGHGGAAAAAGARPGSGGGSGGLQGMTLVPPSVAAGAPHSVLGRGGIRAVAPSSAAPAAAATSALEGMDGLRPMAHQASLLRPRASEGYPLGAAGGGGGRSEALGVVSRPGSRSVARPRPGQGQGDGTPLLGLIPLPSMTIAPPPVEGPPAQAGGTVTHTAPQLHRLSSVVHQPATSGRSAAGGGPAGGASALESGAAAAASPVGPPVGAGAAGGGPGSRAGTPSSSTSSLRGSFSTSAAADGALVGLPGLATATAAGGRTSSRAEGPLLIMGQRVHKVII